MMSCAMNARQLMSALSLPEFQRLCANLDKRGPASVEVPIGGNDTVRMAGRLVERKFDVIQLQRSETKIRAFVNLGHGVCLWTTFAADVERHAA